MVSPLSPGNGAAAPVCLLHNVPRRAGRLGDQLERWHRLCDGLEHPAVELTIEEAAPIFATFHALRRLGMNFDRMLVALLTVLERQAFGGHDDPDDDRDPTQHHDPIPRGRAASTSPTVTPEQLRRCLLGSMMKGKPLTLNSGDLVLVRASDLPGPARRRGGAL